MASSYYLLKKNLNNHIQPCQLRCGRILFLHGTKTKKHATGEATQVFDRRELGRKIAEQLYLSDLFPELSQVCQNDAWLHQPLSNFATIGITDVTDTDCHGATILSVHSKDPAVQKLCDGINKTAHKMICPEKHKTTWRIYGNCLLVSYDSMLMEDNKIWHEYLPLTKPSLDLLLLKFGFLKAPTGVASPPNHASNCGDDVRNPKRPSAPNPHNLREWTDWTDTALSSQHFDAIPEVTAHLQSDITASWDSSVTASLVGGRRPSTLASTRWDSITSTRRGSLVSESTVPEEPVDNEMEQETIYVITITHCPEHFEQCLHDSYELEPLRLFAASKGQSCRLDHGGSIFVHPEQNLQVRAFITLSGLPLGPSNVVVSETYKQLVYGALSRVLSPFYSPLTQVARGSDLFFGTSAEAVIAVSNTFLCPTPPAMRMAAKHW